MRSMAALVLSLSLLLPAAEAPAGSCLSVKASATGRSIRDFGRSQHCACMPNNASAPTAAVRSHLFLLIPGVQPDDYHWPVETGAGLGFHALGISWFDKPASGGVFFESEWAKATGQTDGHNASEAMASCARDVMLMQMLGSGDARVPKVAPDDTVILLHPPPPLVGVSIVMERERQ